MNKLFFTLFILAISFSSFGGEIYHCSSEIKTGIYKDKGVWKTGKFADSRHIINFNDDSTLSGLADWDFSCKKIRLPVSKNGESAFVYETVCVDPFKGESFSFEETSMRYVYVSSPGSGYLHNMDWTGHLEAGFCKNF
jgi:hypothetical protein